MKNVDVTNKAKIFIKFGLISLIILSVAVGYAVFHHYHATQNFQIDNAKVTGTMISVRALTNGKIKELTFKDGDTVKAGDVIAKVEVSVTPEQIQQLEEAVNLAKQNYENLKLGQTVKVPVKRTKVIPAAPETKNVGVKQPVPATIESLAERARRMDELFDMGAVSATQRDAAKKRYEDALTNGVPPSNESRTVEEIEYVDQWQPTPPAVMTTAESAIKQAELALNVAKQEAQQTEITAPFSGVIYYSVIVDENLEAGNVVAKVGSNSELWLEAEVDEEIFNTIPLGKKVTYQIGEKVFEGTLTEKIAPDVVEEEPVEENIITENTFTESAEPINDKYILKFSIPAENGGVEIKPNTTTAVKFSLKNIF